MRFFLPGLSLTWGLAGPYAIFILSSQLMICVLDVSALNGVPDQDERNTDLCIYALRDSQVPKAQT